MCVWLCSSTVAPEYNSPLFLDCCGLVRQVVFDLGDEFGFTLGPWNQAYQVCGFQTPLLPPHRCVLTGVGMGCAARVLCQFDTLPIRKESHTELQPGDLIFYSGTYFNEKKKRQKHDMVHVEIFLGGPSGEATIGDDVFLSPLAWVVEARGWLSWRGRGRGRG